MNNKEQEVGKEKKGGIPIRRYFLKLLGYILKGLFWLFDFFGLRFIYQKIIPPDPETKKRKPSTFFIWVISIYVALFSIASQRYENRIDIIESRVNAIFYQLQTPFYKNAFPRIARVQHMLCPIKPEILKPVSVIPFTYKTDTYSEAVELLKETVEIWKDSLSGVDLSGAKLDSANFMKAKLDSAELNGADLSGADLREADLSTTENLTVKQLLKVKTLYEAKLDSTIVKQFKELYLDEWKELRKKKEAKLDLKIPRQLEFFRKRKK